MEVVNKKFLSVSTLITNACVEKRMGEKKKDKRKQRERKRNKQREKQALLTRYNYVPQF